MFHKPFNPSFLVNGMDYEFLNGLHERVPAPYEYYSEEIVSEMPLLISGRDEEGTVLDVPRIPISCREVIERRLSAPKDVVENWRSAMIFTGDAVCYSCEKGALEALLLLDAEAVRTVNPRTRFTKDGQRPVSRELFQEWKRNRSNLLLTEEEMNAAHDKGYVKRDGRWVPANAAVGKIWDFVGRGMDLHGYVQQVHERLIKFYKSRDGREGYRKSGIKVLGIYLFGFDGQERKGRHLHPLTAERFEQGAYLNGVQDFIYDYDGLLIGKINPEYISE